MNKNNLKKGYFIFGNKGNVWSNNSHIFQSVSSLTLCGVPMLSSNWAKIEDVQEIGCKKCLDIYNEKMKTLLEIINTDDEPNILKDI